MQAAVAVDMPQQGTQSESDQAAVALPKSARVQNVDEKKENPPSDEVVEEGGDVDGSNESGLPPPHQVYIETPVAAPDLHGLENQLQSVSIGAAEDAENAEAFGEGIENGGTPVKLFVGQVRSMFVRTTSGNVKDIQLRILNYILTGFQHLLYL